MTEYDKGGHLNAGSVSYVWGGVGDGEHIVTASALAKYVELLEEANNDERN